MCLKSSPPDIQDVLLCRGKSVERKVSASSGRTKVPLSQVAAGVVVRQVPAAVRRGRPRRSRSRRASPSCVADEVCVRKVSRCTRTSLRRGIGPRPEDRPLPRGVHAVRAVGSAQLVVGFVGESGAAAAAAVEAVDDAVLSGRAPTTKQARHSRDASGRGF